MKQERNEVMNNKFKMNERVEHIKYGLATICSITNDNLWVKFDIVPYDGYETMILPTNEFKGVNKI
jgi:hypothetical protein